MRMSYLLFSIDQFRIIENDVPLLAVFFPKGYIGINNSYEESHVKNILSNDDTFVAGNRQKPLTKKRVNVMLEDMLRGITPFDGEIKRK